MSTCFKIGYLLCLVITVGILTVGGQVNRREPLDERNGHHVAGATQQLGIANFEACKAACVEPCHAVDFNFMAKTCWFHTTDTLCNQVVVRSYAVHVKYATCDRYAHARKGTLDPRFRTEQACVAACADKPLDCMAVDFSANGSSCWLHGQDTACKPLYSKEGCVHYRLRRCPSAQGSTPFVPRPELLSYDGFYVPGGAPRPSHTSREACRAACTPPCVAFDWSPTYVVSPCWLHAVNTACKPLYPNKAFTHTQLINCEKVYQAQSTTSSTVETTLYTDPQTSVRAAITTTTTNTLPTTTTTTTLSTTTTTPTPTLEPSSMTMREARGLACGFPPIEPRITEDSGPVEASAHSWPWMAGVREGSSAGNTSHVCTGVLVNPTDVLTAAHCLNGLAVSPDRWFVRLGDHDQDTAERQEQTISVEEIIIHPKYAQGSAFDDLMVLRLSESVAVNNNADRTKTNICLAPHLDASVFTQCVTAAWGATNNGTISPSLHQNPVSLIPNRMCGSLGPNTEFDRVCAGQRENASSGICQGGQGGPLMCELGGIWFLVGVSSSDEDCSIADMPGVFSRTAYYLSWLRDNDVSFNQSL